ncbi:MAG TPA: response regulator transcription factor [Candidatus Dormibacteraeota bacterium]|nr:response regulator transcription factor [Candidatus Dormibacteraeota bacterium]
MLSRRPRDHGPVRVLVVDDHPVVHDGVALLVERTRWVTIAGTARSGREAIELAERLRPDVVLLDLRLPDMLGSEAVRAIRRRAPGAVVLIFTAHPEHAALEAAREAGAAGMVVKDVTRSDLAEIIGKAARHEPLPWGSGTEDPEATAARLARFGLTRREYDVLRRVALGETNAEIADAICLSRNTVKTYLQSALQKLGARNRVEAIARASEGGLL